MFTVFRGKGAPVRQPTAFMFRANQRKSVNADTGQQTEVRYALPGERPKSRRAPGEPDRVIERFDSYAQGMKRHGG